MIHYQSIDQSIHKTATSVKQGLYQLIIEPTKANSSVMIHYQSIDQSIHKNSSIGETMPISADY
jgi:allophanate hydrolase subunit 1